MYTVNVNVIWFYEKGCLYIFNHLFMSWNIIWNANFCGYGPSLVTWGQPTRSKKLDLYSFRNSNCLWETDNVSINYGGWFVPFCLFVFSPRNNVTRKNEKTKRRHAKRRNNARAKTFRVFVLSRGVISGWKDEMAQTIMVKSQPNVIIEQT